MQSSKLKNSFRFLPDIATADIAFEAFGKTPSELFENAARALEQAMVSTQTVDSKIRKSIIKKEADLADLLYSFLEELVFLKDAEGLVFNRIKCVVKKVDGGWWMVDGELLGEKIDLDKHKLGNDVKAVTKHLFKIEQLPDRIYKGTVVLDV